MRIAGLSRARLHCKAAAALVVQYGARARSSFVQGEDVGHSGIIMEEPNVLSPPKTKGHNVSGVPGQTTFAGLHRGERARRRIAHQPEWLCGSSRRARRT